MRQRTITVRIYLRRNPMRIMFQPDALHHQAPSNHTRHHHTLSGPPEKTSGFNIPNAPTASLHAARCTLHAARCTLHAQLTTTRPQLSVKLSLLPPRHDTASPHSQHRPPTRLSSPTSLQHPTPSRPCILNPAPASGWQPSHILLHDTRSRDTTNTSHFPHTSLATPPSPHLPRYISPATSLPATSTPAPPRPKPSTAASMHSHIGPRPTRIQRFLHMPPTQPH